MSTVGKNIRITIGTRHRELARRLFIDVFSCTLKTPKEELDVFLFADGFSLGAYVNDSECLEPRQHMKAPWLELLVEDPEQTTVMLAKLGIEPFEYPDKAHRYFCPPCGPVFRLARASANT